MTAALNERQRAYLLAVFKVAVNQARQRVAPSEVQQQLGRARIDTTTIYSKLAARDRLLVHAAGGVVAHA